MIIDNKYLKYISKYIKLYLYLMALKLFDIFNIVLQTDILKKTIYIENLFILYFVFNLKTMNNNTGSLLT